MSALLDIAGNHLAFDHYQSIEKICQILFCQTSIKYFAYQRWYADNSYTFLATAPDLGNYFYKEGAYQHNWFSKTSFALMHSGILLWDIANILMLEEAEISQTISKKYGLMHGIDIIEKFENHCNIYSFSSNDAEIYNTSIAFLKRFILYFRQESVELINQAHQEKFYIPYTENIIKPLPTIDFNNQKNNNDRNINCFPIKRFYLNNKHENIYLTQKEVRCLRQLTIYGTAKQASEALYISTRTFENHLANIKLKLGCTQSLELLMIALENNIF